MCATDPSGSLGVDAYTDSSEKNGVAIAVMKEGGPALGGAIDGTPWVIAMDPKATVNGKGGTFPGTDASSGKAVAGDFACTN